jgi:hypothetical protein
MARYRNSRHKRISQIKIVDVLKKIEALLFAAVGTASHQHGIETCTVYDDLTMCSGRHSKSKQGQRR